MFEIFSDGIKHKIAPAKDEFNAMLNYGYGMLYGMIERSVVVAGLDPYIGFPGIDK